MMIMVLILATIINFTSTTSPHSKIVYHLDHLINILFV